MGARRRGAWGLVVAIAAGCASGVENPSSASSVFDPTMPNQTSTTGDSGGESKGPGSNGTVITSADSGADTSAGGDCCEPATSPGCGDAEIESCVCTIEPACCQTMWSPACVDLAGGLCDAPGCPSVGSSSTAGMEDSSAEPPPTLTCEQLAQMNAYVAWRCEGGGNNLCQGMGTPTLDCDLCCEICGRAGDTSCGDLAISSGWPKALCEWNGNDACGGQGTPTCDCDFCCEAG